MPKVLKPKIDDNEKVAKPKVKEEIKLPEVKLFGKWSCDVTVNDLGLKKYMNIRPKLIPRSAGAHRRRFHKSKMHVVERLALHLMIPGHTGKRHRITSGKLSGGFAQKMSIVEEAFTSMEKKENKNPVEIFIKALENAALREEIISYQLGSIVARDAVITAPQRRIDKALRTFAQGSYKKSFKSKKGIAQALAEELLAAYKGSNESFAIKEKERIESEAAGSR